MNNYEYELTPLSNTAFSGVVADEINRLNRELKKVQGERDQWKRTCDIMVACIEEMIEDYGLEPTTNLILSIKDYKEARKEKGV